MFKGILHQRTHRLYNTAIRKYATEKKTRILISIIQTETRKWCTNQKIKWRNFFIRLEAQTQMSQKFPAASPARTLTNTLLERHHNIYGHVKTTTITLINYRTKYLYLIITKQNNCHRNQVKTQSPLITTNKT